MACYAGMRACYALIVAEPCGCAAWYEVCACRCAKRTCVCVCVRMLMRPVAVHAPPHRPVE
eukprot:3870566-Rhodomonas_salina.1